jgi:hypothetical protein
VRRPTPAAERIAEPRRQRWTGKPIAQTVGVSPAAVSRVLGRLGLNTLSALEPAAPVVCYERITPGEMIHLDIKTLCRFGRIGHRITGGRTGQGTAAASAGSPSMPRSTTHRAAPSRRSCPKRPLA